MPQPTTLSGFLIFIGLLLFLMGGKFLTISGVRISDTYWKRTVIVLLGLVFMVSGSCISYRIWSMNHEIAVLTPGKDCQRASSIPEPLFQYPLLEKDPSASAND